MFKYLKWSFLFLALTSCGSQSNLKTNHLESSNGVSPSSQASDSKDRMCHEIKYKVKFHIVDDDIGRDDVGEYKKSDYFIICQSLKDKDIGHVLDTISFVQKHGNEMRVDLRIDGWYYGDDIAFQGDIMMFEGWNTDTDDMDAIAYLSAELDTDKKSDKETIKGKLHSDEFNDDSRVSYKIDIKSKRIQ